MIIYSKSGTWDNSYSLFLHSNVSDVCISYMVWYVPRPGFQDIWPFKHDFWPKNDENYLFFSNFGEILGVGSPSILKMTAFLYYMKHGDVKI